MKNDRKTVMYGNNLSANKTQLSGMKYLSAKKLAQDCSLVGGVVRFEQKPFFRRKMNLTKVIKNGKVKFVSNSDQYDYFEPKLSQDIGLYIVATKPLTAEEKKELKNLKKKYGDAIDEIEINLHNDLYEISIDDEETLKEFGIEKVDRADVLIPLSQFSTHMYIQGRAGSGKSVLYSKFYRAVMGEADGIDDGILKIKPDLQVLEILKQRGVTNLSKREQELIDALKCKNVIIDIKRDIYYKYYRGDFEIKNTDGTITKGKDIMHVIGFDDEKLDSFVESIRKWVNDGVPGTLYLVNNNIMNDDFETLFNIINTVIMNSIVSRIDNAPENLPVYWFGEDVLNIWKIFEIDKYLTYGNPKGLRMFIDTQNNMDLKELYGEKYTFIIESIRNKALFVQGGPNSADFCSKLVGSSRKIIQNSYHDSKNYGCYESRDNNYIEILDSDFMNLKPLEFILLNDQSLYTKISLCFNEIKQMRDDIEKMKFDEH